MIESIVVSAFASLWGWFVLNDPKSLRPIALAAHLLKKYLGDKLVVCPWCIGAWLNIITITMIHTATNELNWILTPISAFAAAGLTGFIASQLPDDGEPT